MNETYSPTDKKTHDLCGFKKPFKKQHEIALGIVKVRKTKFILEGLQVGGAAPPPNPTAFFQHKPRSLEPRRNEYKAFPTHKTEKTTRKNFSGSKAKTSNQKIK